MLSPGFRVNNLKVETLSLGNEGIGPLKETDCEQLPLGIQMRSEGRKDVGSI